MIDRKTTRQIIGYTRTSQTSSASAWYELAKSFRTATEILHEFKKRIPSDSRPFVFNAAMSLELIFKAILAKQNKPIIDGANGHDLRKLCEEAQVPLSASQLTTLELLSETIVWAGRYPAPKTDDRWDEYHDKILEKHIVRSRSGNTFRSVAKADTFPDWQNYLRIWSECERAFQAI